MKYSIFNSLQFKIFLFSLILVLVLLITLGYISYSKSSEILKNKVSLSNLKTVQQTGNNIEFVLDDIHKTSLQLLRSDEVIDFLKLSSNHLSDTNNNLQLKLRKYLSYLINSKGFIYSIYIKGNNGMEIETRNCIVKIPSRLEVRLKELNGMYVWSSGPISNYDSSKTNVFSLCRSYKDINNLSNTLGIMKINIKEDLISDIYKKSLSNIESTFFIIDENRNIISSLDKKKIQTPVDKKILKQEIYNSKYGYYDIVLDNKDYLVTYYSLESTNWKLINMVPIQYLLKDNRIILKTTFISISWCLLICGIFSYFFYYKIFGPLKQVRILMGELEQENYDIYMDIKGNDEIALLGNSFNKMSKRLKEVRNQVYLSKIKQREAELNALQSQINPHFLYNTLDTIYWMTRMENAFESSKLVQSLSLMFRLSLNSGKEFTTVQKEIKHLNSYLMIQKIRYKGMIEFNINVDPETLDCIVIKLVLQPLVENAIYHGIEKKDGQGHVNINIYRNDNRLIYEVIDDGMGADIDYLNELLIGAEENNKGFAIKNVNDRIKLFFGSEYGLKYYNNKTEGIKAVAIQKFVLNEECVDYD